MPVKIYTSTSVESLAKEFGNRYSANSNIFNPMLVVVGSNSTKDWLKESLAKDKGIVANLAFKNTNGMIAYLSKLMGLNETRPELIEPIQLNWLIYSVFGSAEFQENFSDIANYFTTNDLKRFTLAEKVAALFDKYQNLKSDMLDNWNTSFYIPESIDEKWQCYVWRLVIQKTEDPIPYLSKTIDKIVESLDDLNRVASLKLQLPSISFFGQIEYTAEVLVLLKALSNHIDVYLYRTDFTVNESETTHTHNRLVQNFGEFTRTQNALFNKDDFEILHLMDTVAFKPTLLGALKREVLLKDEFSKYQFDDSVTINNCFTKNREVEVFYNYLIKQFEQDPSLGAREVCVMAPDIEEYASAIHAFFTSSDYEIKYTMYDSNINIEESPYAALLALLELDIDDFTSEEVLKLLDFTYLRTTFGFSEDLSLIRRAVGLANIRHGVDGNKLLETNFVSWRYGLKRLMYGICLKNEGDLVAIDGDDFYTVNQFEGTDANDVIRLNYFVEQLVDFIAVRNNSKTLKGWVEFIEESAAQFLNTAEYDLTFFFVKLGKIGEMNPFLNEEMIPFNVFKHQLESLLNGMDGSTKTGFSGVKFASLQPLLTAPARIIAFLGMNNADFPRKQSRVSFDLTSDTLPSITDLDKHLFLNSLLVAADKIYISYVGQNVKDNSNIPPSTVIDELLATIDPLLSKECQVEKIITKHPLHGFSSLYNNDPKLYSYLTENKPLNIAVENYKTQENEPFSTEISIYDLVRFLTDPIKWYYNKILGIYYNEDDATLPETELFSLDNLEKWILQDEILHFPDFNATHLESFRTEKVKKGGLPLRQSGEKILLETNTEIEVLKALFSEITNGESEIIEIKELSLGKYNLSGHIDSIYTNRFAFGTVSKDKYKYRLKALIHYLALVASGKDKIEMCYLHKGSIEVKIISGISQMEAKTILERWCGYFELGNKRILPFTSDVAMSSKSVEAYRDQWMDGVDVTATIVNGIQNSYVSQYVLKEIETGFFEAQENIEEFLEISCDIIGELDFYFN
jgi:exodeoxyribonuclease V gamma subunit